MFLLQVLAALAANVTLPNGSQIVGTSTWNGVNSFYAIPYAKPPVKELRWASPQPAAAWETPLQAQTPGPGCPQQCTLPPGNCPVSQSEDCLILNVFAPASAQNAAVGFFIHGGHFTQGAIDSDLYNASLLASRGGIVIVTVQYRLGALASLSDAAGIITGTYALEDQLLALNWVQENIGAFGGDPTQVVIFGQSAGASSVGALLASPKGAGLFRGAIMESNPWTLPFKDSSSNKDISKRFAHEVGCEDMDLDCLRALDYSTIISVSKEVEAHFDVLHPLRAFMPWTPVVDANSPVLPEQPLRVLLEGNVDVPVMMGTVSNETVLFIYEAFHEELSVVKYDGFLADLFNVHSVDVNKRFPRKMYADNRDTLAFMSDFYIFQCSARAVMTSLKSAWFYWFDHVPSFAAAAWGPNYPFCQSVDCHGNELAFVFGTAEIAGYSYTSEELTLVKTMQTSWINFITSLDPGSSWPADHSDGDNATSVFSTDPSYVAHGGLFESYCNFFDAKIGYVRQS